MSTASAGAPATTFCPAEKRRFVLIAAILASSMGFIDGSVVAIAVPAIRADLGASLAEAQWVSNAYLLLLSALLLVGGAAGDRFGLRTVFAIGIGAFVIASLGCALAPDATVLIVARAVQGLGAAFMVPASLAIIAKAYPKAERGRAIGIWAAASAFTTVFGPILGGILLSWFGDWGWRLVFAINLPLGGLALALLLTRVPSDQPGAKRHLDVIGSLLASVALLLLAYGLTDDAGGSPPALRVLVFSGTGLLLLLGFLAWEHVTKEPMLPLRLFRNRMFAGAQALTFTLYFALGAVLFYLPMTMIGGWGETPFVVSLALMPFGLMLTLVSSASGKLADRIGAGPPIAAGSLLVALAFVLLGLMAPLQDPWLAVLPLMALFGLGMGMVVSPLSTAVMTSVEDSDTGIASGSNNAIARVAGLLAVAAMGGVVAATFQSQLGSAAELHLFFGLPPEEPLPPDLEAVRLRATNAALAAVAYLTSGLAVLSALLAWLTLERRLGGETKRSAG
jgi:EmrB/QacA subfamily drug resistance transporter